MQNKLGKGFLLDRNGHLREAGYSTSLIKKFDRSHIRAGVLRVKEWDYYLIHNEHFAVALTVADNRYMGLVSISFLDFDKRTETTVSPMTLFPLGRMQHPASSQDGNLIFKNKRCRFSFIKKGNTRILTARMRNFKGKRSIQLKVELTDEPRDSMVIATPFAGKPKSFYYNQKIIGMRARGIVRIGEDLYRFSPSDSFGMLDWGRGVWPYKNTWYWGALNGRVNGKTFGFNLGYGFGDNGAATENMLFYDGIAHKLAKIKFLIPGEAEGDIDYMKPWEVVSSDQRLNLIFQPILDRNSHTSVGIIASDQHQVFGYFDGKAVLDDGEILEIHHLLGFAEKVSNKW